MLGIVEMSISDDRIVELLLDFGSDHTTGAHLRGHHHVSFVVRAQRDLATGDVLRNFPERLLQAHPSPYRVSGPIYVKAGTRPSTARQLTAWLTRHLGRSSSGANLTSAMPI